MHCKVINKIMIFLLGATLLLILGTTQVIAQIAYQFPTGKSSINASSLQSGMFLEVVDTDSALVNGADYLKLSQADITEDNAGNGDPDVPDDPDDGGWDWSLAAPNFTHSTGASPTNIYGATAMGLYYAYLATSDASYMTALEDAATQMIADPDIDSAADLIFLMRFQDLPGVASDIYQDAAKSKFDNKVATYVNATGLAEAIRDFRAGGGYENGIIPWDIGAWAVAGSMLADRYPSDPYDYAQAADDIATVIYYDSYLQSPGYFDLTTNKNNGWDPTGDNKDYWWYTLGITGLIDAFVAADFHTELVPGLVTILLECQYAGGGGFSDSYGANPDNEDWQSTAYAVMSLARADQSANQASINNACYWLGTTQDTSGGWVYSDGTHYPEIGGECTSALYFGENIFSDAPSEVWVDDDFNPSSTDGHLWGYDAFDNIQDGIDAVEGSTVNVAAGTYDENVVIAKSLSLIGASSATTIINGNNIGNTVTITASDVTLSGFKVTGGWSNGEDVFWPYGGVVVEGNGGTSALTGITIKDNIIEGNYGNGVYVSATGHGGSASNVVIKDCQINNNGEGNNAGISLTYPNYNVRPVGEWDEWRRPKNILVQGNSIYSNSNYGVYVSAGEYNVIKLNFIWDNSKYGLQLASSWNRADIPCEYTTVEYNGIYDNQRNGVKLTSYNQYNTFTGNSIYNNGSGGTSDYYRYGFLFQDGNNNTIQNNTISGNALGGLYLWGKGDASYTWYSTTDNTITGNTISDHTTSGGHGIYIPANSGNPNSGFLNSPINYNTISNNLAYGLENADLTQTVDALYNFWGHATGADHSTNPHGTGQGGDLASDNVDFIPWYATSTTSPSTENVTVTDSSVIALSDTIQGGIDAALDGDLVDIAAGTYDETLNIDSRSNLTLNGADKNTVMFAPSSTLDWGFYGGARQTAIRVVSSTDIILQNMTMDFAASTGNNHAGILCWDSTGEILNNILKNATLPDTIGEEDGYYYELTAYLRAPSYTDAARAQITVSNNEFINTGRLGIVTHQFVHTTITGNTFYKTIDDFGYAMEIGSASTATVSGNTIYGYDTPAATDDSASAGIYIENSFTGGSPQVSKNVTVENNEIYDCQYGMWIGNGYNGYAGDVDINVTLNNNNFHNNVEGGAWIQDEDKEDGSSVTVSGSGNYWMDNGMYGMRIYTEGDGDITVNLTDEMITGNDIGISVEDTAGEASSSSYTVSINDSTISDNTTMGIENTSTFMVNAEVNWWGNISGPYDGIGDNEVMPCTEDPTTEINTTGEGNEVTDNVDYCPWYLYPDADSDSDGICNPYASDPSCTGTDNCPEVYNPGQEDTYPPGGNGVGDACECESDFDCDRDVDADDVGKFLWDFGRNEYNDPCTNDRFCYGDYECDGDVDSTDVTKFLEDFGRNMYNNPCPAVIGGL